MPDFPQDRPPQTTHPPRDALDVTRATVRDGDALRRSRRPAIDGYEIICETGQGGMGVVFQARDLRLDRLVAIKTLLAELALETSLDLLRREARMAAKLRHPNIVAVHALIDTSDPPCVVMEWVDGVPLDAVMPRIGFPETARLMLKIARAVAYAHEAGVVHRDLKPGNILVDRSGEPRLLDFGLARATRRPDDASTGDGIKGTPLYMAPEQFESPEDVGPAADIFALGLVLYVLLTGSRPPAAPSGATPSQWARRELPFPREVADDVPEPLQRICLKSCELRPEDRYRTAGQMADDLQRFLDGRDVLARPTRYGQLLQERVATHIDALARWEQERLISRREADALQDRYLRLLRTEALWVPGARKLRPGAVLIQAGGWLVVVSTVLWATIYWKELTSFQRLLSIGIPTIIINGAALDLWRRSSQLIAMIFTFAGALLVPLFALVVFSEIGLLSGRAADAGTFELLPPEYFSNQQLVAAFWLAAAYSAWLLYRKRFALFSVLNCIMLTFCAAATLLPLGLRDWISREQFATVAASLAIVPLLVYAAARALDRRTLEHLAPPFYAVAAVGFVIVVGALVYDAPRTWMKLPSYEESSGVNPRAIAQEVLFLSGGLICFVLAWLHDRSNSRLCRLWGALYYRIVPPALVVSVDLLGEQPMLALGTVGGSELRAVQLAVPLLCILLIVLGTGLQLRWFTYYGLLHLAIFIVRITHRHFRDYLSWPVIIIVVGSVTILVGLWLEHRRSRDGRRVQLESGKRSESTIGGQT